MPPPNGPHLNPTHTLVLGGGLGGIAVALRLAALGDRVTLVERLDQLGGRARTFERGAFRFDAGPTVITAPHLIDELFVLFGRRLADAVRMIPLHTFYRFSFEEGGAFEYGGSPEEIATQVTAFAPGDAEGYRRLMGHANAIFHVAFEGLADKPFHRLTTLLRHAPALVRLGAWRSVFDAVSAHIRNPQLRRALSTSPMLVGGHPFHTTSIYLLIHALEQRWGVHYPEGGMGALVGALEVLMREAGIEIVTGHTVVGLPQARSGRVLGAVLDDGTRLSADRVVSDLDPAELYDGLLQSTRRRRWGPGRIARAHHSMGLYILYLGTRRTWPEVGQHNVFLTHRFQESLDQLFFRGQIPDPPSYYLHRPTATDPGMAPPGCDSLYCLVPVPNLQHPIDWTEAGPRLRERLLADLEARLLPGLREHLVHAFALTPEGFRDDYRSRFGAGFSLAPLFTQSAWFRFHNRSEEAPNLFLVGAGTHPGAGVPGVLSSARVVERLIRGA